MENSAIWEDSLAASDKTNIFLSHNPAIMLLGIYLKLVENLCPHKHLHMDVNSSFIHNCPNLEETKMSFSRWMDKW